MIDHNDINGEFPRADYQGQSSLNLSAQGGSIHVLETGGSVEGLDLELQPGSGSVYPNVKTVETPGGHVTEYDDTIGNERILIKHSSGAGIEFRPDGSILVVSGGNKVEILAGSHKLIVEGNGEMNYKGSLNLKVDGDYNVDVGGNYNVKVGGSKSETIAFSTQTYIMGNCNEVVKGSLNRIITGNAVQTHLSSYKLFSKGDVTLAMNGSATISASGALKQSSESSMSFSSQSVNMTAPSMTIIGSSGTIGGAGMVAYASTFHGDLTGVAEYAELADRALGAPLAVVTGSVPTRTNTATINPSSAIVSDATNKSSIGVSKVKIDPDDSIKNSINRSKDNGNATSKTLTSAQAISKLRNTKHASNTDFLKTQIAEGKLSSSVVRVVPLALGRTFSGVIRGEDLIGSDSSRKRFQATGAPRRSFQGQIGYDPIALQDDLDFNGSTRVSAKSSMGKFLGSSTERTSLDHMQQGERLEVAKYLHVQAYFADSAIFKRHRIVVDEGIYRPEKNEEIQSGSLADLGRNGRAISYTVVNQGGSVDNAKVFDLARQWSQYAYFDKLRLDYHTYDPDGIIRARVYVELPELDDTYSGSFSGNLATYYNGSLQAPELVEIML
jgi:hypothetical protein